MRIAYFVIDFPALSQTFVLNQITGLLDRGHEVHVFARWAEKSTPHPDVERYGLLAKTHYWPAMPANQALRLMKAAGIFASHGTRIPAIIGKSLRSPHYGRLATLRELVYGIVPVLREGEYDVTHCQFDHVGIHAVALREIGVLRGPIVTTFHDYGVTRFLRLKDEHVFDDLFAAGDLFLPISEYTRGHLLRLGCPAERIRIHHMGVDCRRFAVRPPAAPSDAPVRMMSVGRLVEKKGIEYGIRAVAELRRRGVRCEYNVVGQGPRLRPLQALIDELQLGDCVHLLGPKTQDVVAELLSRTDIFAAPSVTAPDGDEEGVPVVLMEAMATGLPVVSTLYAGIPELVQEGVSGYLVPERDVPALTDRLAELAADPQRRQTMGLAGRRFVEEHFNIETLNDQLAEILENVARSEPERERGARAPV